jgi:hypothetical protein
LCHAADESVLPFEPELVDDPLEVLSEPPELVDDSLLVVAGSVDFVSPDFVSPDFFGSPEEDDESPDESDPFFGALP